MPSDVKQWRELEGNEFGPAAKWLVRAMDIADYQHVVALWQRSKGVSIGESDTKGRYLSGGSWSADDAA